MLTAATVKRFKSVGFSVKKAQEAFLAACRDAIEELGGKHWKKRDLPLLFRQLEKEVRVPLCLDKDGPQMTPDTFKKYMSAAKKSLLFGVPFRMGWMVSYDDLPAVKETVEKDNRKVDMEQKVKDAIKELRDEKRELQERSAPFVRLPLPDVDSGDEWVEELLAAIAAVLDRKEAQILQKRHPRLKKLAGLTRHAKTGAA